MPTVIYTVYGPGGFDSSLPDNNILERYEVEVEDDV